MKSAPKPPAAPDPTKIANAQETASINTGIAQKALNNTGQSNPFGTSGYAQTGTVNVDGNQVPTYGQTSSLSPLLQSLLTQQEGAASGAAGNLNTSPLNFSSLPSVSDPTLLSQNTSDALYNQATSRLDPAWNQRQTQLQNQLAEQGIAQGSDAYTKAMDDFNRQRNDAYTSAQNSATQYGVQDASTLLNSQIAARNQGINEQITGQNQPVDLLSRILSGVSATGGLAPSTTSTPSSVQAPDVTNAYALQQNQLNQNYQNQLAQYNSMLGGLGGLAGNALMYAMLGPLGGASSTASSMIG